MIRKLFAWIMENEYTCGFGHTFTGVLASYLLLFGYPSAGAVVVFSFIAYEGLEQFRFQSPKDDADEEIRQSLMGLNIGLVAGLIVKALF